MKLITMFLKGGIMFDERLIEKKGLRDRHPFQVVIIFVHNDICYIYDLFVPDILLASFSCKDTEELGLGEFTIGGIHIGHLIHDRGNNCEFALYPMVQIHNVNIDSIINQGKLKEALESLSSYFCDFTTIEYNISGAEDIKMIQRLASIFRKRLSYSGDSNEDDIDDKIKIRFR